MTAGSFLSSLNLYMKREKEILISFMLIFKKKKKKAQDDILERILFMFKSAFTICCAVFIRLHEHALHFIAMGENQRWH